jgi:hypothetical protein
MTRTLEQGSREEENEDGVGEENEEEMPEISESPARGDDTSAG